MRRSAAAGLALAAIAALGGAGQAGTDGQRVTVKSGDTLAAIAQHYGISVADLAEANGIRDPDLIVIGQTITIPAAADAATATTHTVRAGENLSMIADTYATTVDAIVRANGLANPNLVIIGSTLTIPADTTGLPAKLRAHPERLALRPAFERWAAAYGVPADLLEGLAWIESGWQSNVVSSTNARGVGQLMPDTVDHMRLVLGDSTLDPFNADDNIRMSARMLALLLQQTGGDVRTAVGAYYQGLRSVREQGFLPQTEAYIGAVLGVRARFA